LTQKQVLLVEDNDDNRTIYATILGHYGYEVVEAPNGLDGVNLADRHRPDLIIMDISLPVMDGLEATRRIRANPNTSAIPVLAVTAHALDSDRERVIDAGCNNYLAKPVEPRRLLEQVERMIGKSCKNCRS
jgi:two-component system, cell cycle response regulator DivK